MESVDIDIYLNNFISFFEKNPDSLIKLIGDINKDLFFSRIKEKCIENLKNNEDVSLTKKQLEELIVNMWKEQKMSKKFDGKFLKTKFGLFSLS